MARLGKVISNLEKFSLPKVLVQVYRKEKIDEFVIDLNREKQLFEKGVGVDGQVVGYYSLVTSLIDPKKSFNTHYTFKDTGEFFRSFTARFTSDGAIELNANDIKEGQPLEDKYNTKLIGLTIESKIKLVEKLRPTLIEEIRRAVLI